MVKVNVARLNWLKKIFLGVAGFLFLSGCVGGNTDTYLGFQQSGYIKSYDSQKIRLRHIDTLNALRIEQGLNTLVYSRALNASAETHARDMSYQKRAWNFGSDHSSPGERSIKAGFRGIIRGENISETFEGEFEVLQVWVKNPISKMILFDPKATHLGFGWYQEPNGTIWWVQDLGQETL